MADNEKEIKIEDGFEEIDDDAANEQNSDSQNENVQDENTDDESVTGQTDDQYADDEIETGQTDDDQKTGGDTADDTDSVEKPEDEDPDNESSSDRKSLKKDKTDRKDKKEKKDKKDAKVEELSDRLLRLMAEYDNYRKRTEREKSAMFEMGARSVAEKILPVIDNFERGFASLSDEDKENPFVQGMDKIYTQFLSTLEGVGVTPIEAVGKEFDPNFHNAIMHVDDEEFGDNIVVEEFQKGYMYRDSVLRCSMVKVAN